MGVLAAVRHHLVEWKALVANVVSVFPQSKDRADRLQRTLRAKLAIKVVEDAKIYDRVTTIEAILESEAERAEKQQVVQEVHAPELVRPVDPLKEQATMGSLPHVDDYRVAYVLAVLRDARDGDAEYEILVGALVDAAAKHRMELGLSWAPD